MSTTDRIGSPRLEGHPREFGTTEQMLDNEREPVLLKDRPMLVKLRQSLSKQGMLMLGRDIEIQR